MSKLLKSLVSSLLVVGSMQVAQAADLSEAQAREAIKPFYDAFTVAPDRDSEKLVLAGTADNWESCSADDVCKPRVEAAKTIGGFGKAIPDLKWEIKEVVVYGNRVVVRGEGSGTPAVDFMGVPHNGKSFKLMSIDIHHIENDKIAGKTYHLEDWAGALRQLSAK